MSTKSAPEVVVSHTPGPWIAQIADVEGMTECTVMDVADTMAFRLCVTVPEYEPQDHHDEAKANVRLSAAAPELLEALRFALAALPPSSKNEDWDYANIKRIGLEAIAKATGGAQ